MMQQRLARYETMLHQLAQKDRRRGLAQLAGIDFTSNDYLGLAGSTRLSASVISAVERGVPVGAGGSRLLRGNHPEHVLLETEAAAFFRSERVLYFGSGYAANVAIFSTLPQRGDIIVHDALVHASTNEGIAASRAEAVAVAHNDVEAFDTAIHTWRKAGGTGHPWIAIESLYSMDGDRAPLSELAELADRHDGFLVIDEAHATGIYGDGGRGLSADMEGRDNIIVLHTCGKALGSAGALVSGSHVICDFLVNRARPFIYATAPSPLLAASVRQALKILTDEPKRRQKLLRLIAFANVQLTSRLGIEGSGSQILPIIIGDDRRTVSIARRMQAEGFDIRAIRPPTVPEGTARLRIAITLNVDTATITRMFDQLARVMEEEVAMEATP
jgi:8-amino-7-oxononanoate synthase